MTGTYQHVGSRYTQLGDQEPGSARVDLLSFGANTIGGPLTQSTFTFDPLLPAYDLVNLRFGVRHGNWDIAFYVNNLTDERAFLALDQERGTPRPHRLPDQPAPDVRSLRRESISKPSPLLAWDLRPVWAHRRATRPDAASVARLVPALRSGSRGARLLPRLPRETSRAAYDFRCRS